MNAEQLFHEALHRTPAERPAFLAAACAGDEGLLRRVEALLHAHENPGSFLAEQPAGELPQVGGTQEGDSATVPLRRLPPDDDEVIGTWIGPYKLLQQIGEGGMGTVYMAEQTQPVVRKVALKVIKSGMDTRGVIARFEAERQALAMMDHVNIAKVLDAGEVGPVCRTGPDESPARQAGPTGRPYFVMELVRGVPITKYCDDNHLTPRERLELFVPVCLAIQHAHQKGVIHRDIKPSNVLVTLYDGKPAPKVIDFGVAKATEQKLTERTLFTQFGTLVGTLEYMSPEQAEMSALGVDTRSDIYSLGVLLYELLTGSTPLSHRRIKEAAFAEVLRIIKEEEPPKPSTRISDSGEALASISANRHTEPAKLTRLVRGELDWIVMKTLEKDRNRRYETANGLALDLQRYLADEPVLACPPSKLYRVKKFVRRNRGAVLAASLVVLTLVAGVVGTTWGMLEARERAEGERLAKERAEENFDLAYEAVEKYLGTVTKDPQLQQADFHRLRKKLLESALPFFQRLVEQKGDDPKVEAGRGRAYRRLAGVRFSMGETESAIDDVEAAHAIFIRLADASPDEARFRFQRAQCLENLGLYRNHLGQHAAAETALRKAFEMWEALAAEFPDESEYRQQLANAHNHLALLLDDVGQHDEAGKHYCEAVNMLLDLAEASSDAEDYEDAARCLGNLGALFSDVGRNDLAEEALRQAMEIQEQLVEQIPTEPQHRQELAGTFSGLAIVLKDLGKSDDAEKLYRKAIANAEKIADAFPTVPRYRQDLSGIYINLATLIDEDPQKADQAEEVYRQALKIQQRLVDDFPDVPEYRRRLAAGNNNQGLLFKRRGQREQADAAYRRAMDTMEELVARFSNVPVYAVELGGAYCNFGHFIAAGGQPEKALEWFDKAIDRLEPIVSKESRLADARINLRNSVSGKADALDNLGRHEEAAQEWRRAAELDSGPRRPAFRLRMFRSLKDHAGCLAAAAEYETLKGMPEWSLYDAACVRAVCAAVILEDAKASPADAPRLAQEQADLAMTWLQKAIDDGYHDLDHMRHDSDLDALREREDYKQLCAELEELRVKATEP